MSYSERDGQVVLTMSREDYDRLLLKLGIGWALNYSAEEFAEDLKFLNRLNSGNLHYTPYQVPEKP